MNRTAAIVVAAILELAALSGARGGSPESLALRFAAWSPDCPRGTGGGPPDLWTTACLLARYGERERACSLLASVPEETAFGGAGNLRTRLLIELGRYETADSALALRPHARDRFEFYLHQLRRARANALAGRSERALDLLRRLDRISYPEFDPYRDLLLVDALLGSGRAGEAVETARRRFAAGYPRSLTPAFESKTLDALVAAGLHADALVFLDTLRTRTVRKAALAPVLAREADVRFDLGDTLGAIRAVREFIEAHGAAKALAAAETVVSRGNPAGFENGALVDLAEVFVANRKSAKAETLLAILEARVLGAREAETVRLLRSEIFYNAGRYSTAASLAEPLFADPALERRAKLLRARAYRGAGERAKAARAYRAFAGAYPYDPKAPEALYVAWDLYRGIKSPNAEGILERIVETYPENKYAKIATRRIALDHIERRRYAEAVRVLEDAQKRWGREDEALLYYLASSYGKLGRHAEERKVMGEIAYADSFSFYLNPGVSREFARPSGKPSGERAGPSDELRGFLECAAARRADARGRISREIAPWTADAVFADAAPYLTRGLKFLEMGFRDWGEAELRIFESWKGLPPRAFLDLSAVYDDCGMPARSVRAAQRLRDSVSAAERRRLGRALEILLFPSPFPITVMENCERFGMAPHLVYAMMREESRFDEKAVSGAGARGLLQLMPGTAGELAGKLGFPDNARDLFSPDFNVTVGVFYASELLAESKGDPLMMLAGYNAGFSNARRWFGGGAKGTSIPERVDRIDYWETCDYVKKIVESAHVYHDLYFSSPKAANCE